MCPKQQIHVGHASWDSLSFDRAPSYNLVVCRVTMHLTLRFSLTLIYVMVKTLLKDLLR